MPTTQTKKIIRQYARTLKKARYPFRAMYLFGSYAKKKANKWSDIDVAVITDALNHNYERNYERLNELSLDVDTKLEPHGFTPQDFADDANPLAYEIRRTGIRVV